MAFFLHSSLHSAFLQASIENLNKNYIRKEFWNKPVGLMVAQLDSKAFSVVLYPSPAGTNRSLECLLCTHVILQERNQNRTSCKWDILSDYIGEKNRKQM